jgi:hypothetical protein
MRYIEAGQPQGWSIMSTAYTHYYKEETGLAIAGDITHNKPAQSAL